MILSVVEYPFEECGRLQSWRYSIGDKFDKGSIIGTFNSSKNQSELKLISEYDGTIKNIFINDSKKELNKGDKLYEMEYCTHDIQFSGLCATCGREVIDQQESLSILHGHSHLTVSHKEAARIGDINTKRLIKEKKLSLVLDLDHTVIHAVTEQGLNSSPEWRNKDKKKCGIHNITVNGPMNYCIKKRPYLVKFLTEVNKIFELHIYTMGTRNYANEIAKLIDPESLLFKERILSRDDGNGINFKSLQRLFPCDDSMVLIVDDRSDVWKKSKNLIQISPYVYFTDIIDSLHHEKQPQLLQQQKLKEQEQQQQNKTEETGETKITDIENKDSNTENIENNTTTSYNLENENNNNNNNNGNEKENGKDNKEEEEEEEEEDKKDIHLLIVLDKLQKIHRLYYESKDKGGSPHVIDMVDIVKKDVLKDQYIVFSGVYPLGTPIQKQPLRYLAEEFGGEVQNEINSQTTHVIAQRKGTSKVNKAIAKGIKVVSPQWLIESTRIWQIADAEDFSLPDLESTSPTTTTSTTTTTTNNNGNTSAASAADDEDDEDDETKAANLPNVDVFEVVGAFNDDADKELEDFLDGESDADSQGSSNASVNSSDYENDDDNDDNDGDNDEGENKINKNDADDDNKSIEKIETTIVKNNKVSKKRKRRDSISNSSISSGSSGSNGSSYNNKSNGSSSGSDISSSGEESDSSDRDDDNDDPNSDNNTTTSKEPMNQDEDDITNFLEAELDKFIE